MKRLNILIAAGVILLAITVVTALWQLPPASSGLSGLTTTTAFQKINLNTATAEELTAVPGIGTKLAGKIVDLRTQVGGFSHLYQLVSIDGITKNMVDGWQEYLTL